MEQDQQAYRKKMLAQQKDRLDVILFLQNNPLLGPFG